MLLLYYRDALMHERTVYPCACSAVMHERAIGIRATLCTMFDMLHDGTHQNSVTHSVTCFCCNAMLCNCLRPSPTPSPDMLEQFEHEHDSSSSAHNSPHLQFQQQQQYNNNNSRDSSEHKEAWPRSYSSSAHYTQVQYAHDVLVIYTLTTCCTS
jgi:hypothetical protein